MAREILIEFMDSLRDYVGESGTNLAHDERDSSEFVDIFLKDNPESKEVPTDDNNGEQLYYFKVRDYTTTLLGRKLIDEHGYEYYYVQRGDGTVYKYEDYRCYDIKPIITIKDTNVSDEEINFFTLFKFEDEIEVTSEKRTVPYLLTKVGEKKSGYHNYICTEFIYKNKRGDYWWCRRFDFNCGGEDRSRFGFDKKDWTVIPKEIIEFLK